MKVTPKDFFLWAGAMVALYFSVGSFVALAFAYIDYWFGPYVGFTAYSSGMQFAIACLIVLFPVFVYLMRVLQQDIRHTPEKKELWVRRWLVFLTVFGAAIGMIIDLIVLLTTYLSGEEITTAFALKVFAVLAIFGAVFYYFLNDVRGTWERNERKSKNIAYATSVMVLGAVVGAFFVMGTPHTQRLLRYDDQRISDLQNLQSSITEYYRTTEKLPASLEVLKDPLVGSYVPTDPSTNALYGYTTTGSLTFTLCATFDLPFPHIDETRLDVNDWQARDMLQKRDDWNHNAGETCFERSIDTERVTPYPKTR